MTTIFDSPEYQQADASRIENLVRCTDLRQLLGCDPRIFETGCGVGNTRHALRNILAKQGCSSSYFVSVDARAEHILEARRRYPDQQEGLFHVLDLEQMQLCKIRMDFDAVLCFGTLYHVRNPYGLLEKLAQLAPVLILETIVVDSTNEQLCFAHAEQDAPDQAFGGGASRFSYAWLRKTLKDLGYDAILDFSYPRANWPTAVFDWKPQNDGTWLRDGNTLRRMYLCHRPPYRSQKLEEKYILEAVERIGDHTPGGARRSFLDIGAYDGWHFSNTARLAGRGWPGVMVEPNFHAFEALYERYQGNNNVQLVLGMVGERTYAPRPIFPADTYTSTDNSGHSTKVPHGREYYVQPVGLSELLCCVSPSSSPSVVSIDTEGTSMDILHAVLERCTSVAMDAPQVIVVEHDNRLEELRAYEPQYNIVHVNAENAVMVLK